MLLKPAAAACAGGSWRGEPRRRGGLYSLEQPESAAGLELRLPAWPLPSSGSLLGQEEVVGAARSSGGLGRAGMGCSRCSWLGPCRARPLRVGMGPPHLPETFLRAACSALGEAERDFQERGGSPSSAQLVFPPAKNAARLCTWGESRALLTPCQPRTATTRRAPALQPSFGTHPLSCRACLIPIVSPRSSCHSPWVCWGLCRAGDIPPAVAAGPLSAVPGFVACKLARGLRLCCPGNVGPASADQAPRVWS